MLSLWRLSVFWRWILFLSPCVHVVSWCMSVSAALLLKQCRTGLVACHIAAATVCNGQNNASNLVRIKLILLRCHLFQIIVKAVNGEAICLCFCLVRRLLIWPRFRTPKWRMIIKNESEWICRELVRVCRKKFEHSKKYSNSLTGLYMPWGFHEVEAPRFRDSRHVKVVRLALSTCRLYPPGNIPGTHFCYRLSRPQGHSAAGNIMSMKYSGNRTRNLPACSTVPQPTAPPRPTLRALTRRRQIAMRFTGHFWIFGFQYVLYCVSRCRCPEFGDGSYIFRKFVDASVFRFLTWRFSLRISHSEFFEMPFLDSGMERNMAGPYL